MNLTLTIIMCIALLTILMYTIVNRQQSEYDRLLAAIKRHKHNRAKVMPNEDAALRVMFAAYTRLKELGFRDIIGAPKDGSKIEIVESGSTGIHIASYTGEWPHGSYESFDGHESWAINPCLFRRMKS